MSSNQITDKSLKFCGVTRESESARIQSWYRFLRSGGKSLSETCVRTVQTCVGATETNQHEQHRSAKD